MSDCDASEMQIEHLSLTVMHLCLILKHMETLKDHLLRVTGEPSVRSLALEAGIEPSTLARQLGGGEAKVQTVVAICRHYNLQMLPAFVAAGYITCDEAAQISSFNIRSLTDRELAEEILRRASGNPTSVLHAPVS